MHGMRQDPGETRSREREMREMIRICVGRKVIELEGIADGHEAA